MNNNYSSYDLFFSNITTPFNLLNNYKLENYDYVKYYTKNNFTVCEMKCTMDSIMTIFYYYFDNNNFLQKIEMEQDNKTEIKFDRQEMITNHISTKEKTVI